MLYGIFAIVFLFMLLTTPQLELLQIVFLAVIVCLLLVGLGASLITVYRMGSERPAITSGDFVCKHCGKVFNNRRAWESHQRSCAEMRL